jgi:putative tricarboxylic transport membrane protein
VNRKYWDLVSGIVLFLFSIALFIGSLNVKTLAVSSIGSGFFPAVVAIMFAITSLVVVFGGIKQAKGKDLPADDKAGKPRVMAVVGTFVLMAGYAALLVGFMITTAVYLFLQINILAENQHRKPVLFGIISVVTSVSVYYLFVMVFHLMLPAGILG